MAKMRRSKLTQTALGVLLLVLFVLITPTTVFSQDATDDSFAMPYESYFIAGGCHADGWGTGCALDVNNSINGGPLLSSITGEVVAKGSNDGYGNPYLILENSRWKVYYLHGIYDLISVGDPVVLGQHIGTEASIGRSTGAHTHLSLYDKRSGRWVNPLHVLTGSNTFVSGEGLSHDSSPNPQPPGEVAWNVGIVGEFRVEAETETEGGVQPEQQETELEEQVPSQQQVIVTQEQQQTGFLATIPLIVWGIILLLLFFLLINRDSRSWWPLWLVLLVLVFLGFMWSRRPVPAQLNIPVESTSQAEFADTEGNGENEAGEAVIIFPAIPEPIVEAIQNNPPITVPQGSEYFPDPGPTMVRTVEIVWEVAEERGIPPQFLLAKLYYEGGYMYNERWMGLRNWKPDGSMTKSYSYADCRGIGQVCKFYHPNFDQARAGDLNDPEAALRYSASYAADFIVQLFNKTGDWSQVVLRYHGTQAEGSKGLEFTRNFIVNPPINPETGQPAWPAASIDIMSESTLRR